jgi:DNA-binding MarR family transcriptional regulator
MRDDATPESCIAGECLAGHVRVLSRVVTGIYDDALRPHKVRVSQMNVLVAVAAMGPVRAADVCRRLRLDKSTLSRDLDRLLDRGWVRATPGVGRSQVLEATPAGRAVIRKVLPAWEEAQARVRGVLGAALMKGLLEAADRIGVTDIDRR